jgi:hypothetical protein
MWALPLLLRKQFGEDKRAEECQKEWPGSHGGELGGGCIAGEIL